MSNVDVEAFAALPGQGTPVPCSARHAVPFGQGTPVACWARHADSEHSVPWNVDVLNEGSEFARVLRLLMQDIMPKAVKVLRKKLIEGKEPVVDIGKPLP